MSIYIYFIDVIDRPVRERFLGHKRLVSFNFYRCLAPLDGHWPGPLGFFGIRLVMSQEIAASDEKPES